MKVTPDTYQADLDRAYCEGRRDGIIDALYISASTIAGICLVFGAVWYIAADAVGRWP